MGTNLSGLSTCDCHNCLRISLKNQKGIWSGENGAQVFLLSFCCIRFPGIAPASQKRESFWAITYLTKPLSSSPYRYLPVLSFTNRKLPDFRVLTAELPTCTLCVDVFGEGRTKLAACMRY